MVCIKMPGSRVIRNSRSERGWLLVYIVLNVDHIEKIILESVVDRQMNTLGTGNRFYKAVKLEDSGMVREVMRDRIIIKSAL